MSNHVSVDNLSKKIQEYLYEYHEDITDEVKETAQRIGNEAKAELIRLSPVSDTDVILKGGTVHKKGEYAKGWTISSQSSKNVHVKKIWNKTNYQLTHLLEFGHLKRNGTRWVNAQPHVRDTEKTYLKKFEKELETEIKNG